MVMKNVFSYIRVHYMCFLASLMIGLILLLNSCGAGKQVVSSESSEEIENYDSIAVAKRLNRRLERLSVESQKVTSHLKYNIVRREFSQPDSCGKQYVAAEVRMVVDVDEDTDITANITEDCEIDEEIDSLSRNVIIANLQTDEFNEQITGPPWWQAGLIMIGLTSLIICTIRIIIRLR